MLDHLRSITASGPDCLTLVCPTCFDQFDLGQIKASRGSEEKFSIPVLYYFQLLGIAQGFSAAEMGLQYHRTKVGDLLARGSASRTSGLLPAGPAPFSLTIERATPGSADALLTMEIIIGPLHALYFGSVVVSSVLADVVAHSFEGDINPGISRTEDRAARH